jgi:SAM-dependent methyltransferase
MDPRVEMQHSARVAPVVEGLKGATRILDVACGNGAFAIASALADPAAHVLGVDYAQGNIDVARQAASELGVSDRCTFLCAPAYDFQTHQPASELLEIGASHGPFDGVFIGEFCEHIANVGGLLTAVHAMTTTGARVVLTMPSGPFMELLDKHIPVRKGHVHHFRPDDLGALFGQQDALDVAYLESGLSPRGARVGHWIASYRTNGKPVGERPIAKRIRTTRPKASLSVGILAGETVDIRRCLESVWHQADEVILGNTGADAEELASIAAAYPRTRIVDVGQVASLAGGFSEARNRVLEAATGDWFLWIDTDERLVGAPRLHRYLDSSVFIGYGLKQNHLMLDTPNTFDTPIRVFRRRPDIQFYGCIHEQPQMGDCNGDIIPSLQLYETEIAHTGYLNEDVRREKAIGRNLPLLIRDAEMFPRRRLGRVLLLRDSLNLGVWEQEAAGGTLTPAAQKHYQQCIALFETNFADPSDKYHGVARPFYEQAVRRVRGAIECEVAFAAEAHGLKRRAKPERFWVRTPDQIVPLLAAKQREWMAPFAPHAPIDVAPIVSEVEGVAV